MKRKRFLKKVVHRKKKPIRHKKNYFILEFKRASKSLNRATK